MNENPSGRIARQVQDKVIPVSSFIIHRSSHLVWTISSHSGIRVIVP
jgi:hypothetical protein